MDTPMGKSTVGEMLPLFIIIGILLLFIIFCIKMIRVISKTAKKQKKQLNELKNAGMTVHAALNHINGLPIAENILCEIFSYPDKFEFKSGSMHFNLQKSKITDMTIKTDTEIQQQYVSSIGGAVGGAVLFGPIGAMIGGRAKSKKTRTVHSYLIITYMNDSEVKYIGFDVTNSLNIAYEFIKEFKETNTAITSVDL